MKGGIAIGLSDKVDCKLTYFFKRKEERFIMIK